MVSSPVDAMVNNSDTLRVCMKVGDVVALTDGRKAGMMAGMRGMLSYDKWARSLVKKMVESSDASMVEKKGDMKAKKSAVKRVFEWEMKLDALLVAKKASSLAVEMEVKTDVKME